MNNLDALSLKVDVPATINLLNRTSLRLTKLTCILPPEHSYPISRLLLSQPAIEELHIVCQPDDLTAMEPVALPVLKELTAPLQLLPKLLTYQLPRLSRLCILDILSNTQLLLVAAVLALSHLPESIELVLRVEITPAGKTGVITRGLYRLGKLVPCIRSLRLDTYGELIEQDDLRNMFAPVLLNYPNLEKVTFTSQPLTPDEYTRNCAQVQSDPTSSGTDPSSQSVLAFVSDTLVNLADAMSAALSVPPFSLVEPGQRQDN